MQVVTQALDGLARDENVQGIEVHRWVRPYRVGPLFALSFVAGVIRACTNSGGATTSSTPIRGFRRRSRRASGVLPLVVHRSSSSRQAQDITVKPKNSPGRTGSPCSAA